LNRKILIGASLVAAGFILVVINLSDAVIEYGDFNKARQSGKKIRVKGEWIREREVRSGGGKFIFYMKDDTGETEEVILNGKEPENFKTADGLVVWGKFVGNYFAADKILTKCPSKYEFGKNSDK
jgi:cytochrome c-type biogenesis protein CcmE